MQMLKPTAVGTLSKINPCLEVLTVNVVMRSYRLTHVRFYITLIFLSIS